MARTTSDSGRDASRVLSSDSEGREKQMRGDLIAVVAALASACAAPRKPPAPPAKQTALRSPKDGNADARAWRTAYDWDGDGEKDEVEDRFSGGAHCCYRVGVRLSSKQKTTWLPFWIEGGYAYPMDLPDIPEQFSVGRTPGGLPEIRMRVATYNGRPERLPQSWRDRYRIRSHHLGISFPKGNMRVRDLPRAAAGPR